MKTKLLVTLAALASLLLSGCATRPPAPDRAELKNIVERSYQYVAMYNTLLGFAMNEKNPFTTHGWNKTFKPTGLLDHTVRVIAAPNNDTLYVVTALDLRKEPVIVTYPAFDSKFVSVETSAFDHYCDIPLAKSKGDFAKPVSILFYTDRTEGYAGEPVPGVDVIHRMTGDFATSFARVMPHAAEPERSARILAAIQKVEVRTLSAFQGKPAKTVEATVFPKFGSDLGVFTGNFTEVMQFVVNHTTFSADNELDRAFLAAMKRIGIQPGKRYDPANVASIDQALMEATVKEVQQSAKANVGQYTMNKFRPKGQMSIGAMVAQSVTGPVGQPIEEAAYFNVFNSADGKVLNAQHDYMLRISKDELPPAQAFWSFTLMDAEDAFFIPNDRKKYSVGENAGMKLRADGGIDICIAAEKPADIPEENWLPISRQDLPLRIQIRAYRPVLEKIQAWKPPGAVRLH
jgi:hypothetical protein